MIDIRAKKENIVSYLKINGPSLPVRISKAVGLDPVLGSAVLSEVFGEGRVKMSNLRVGSSSLFFIDGQEEQLERFSEYLKSGEKVAYSKLKREKILKDSIEEPAIRVALRSIKDFAIPFRYNEELMWRYAFVSEDEVRKMFGEDKGKETKEEKIVQRREPEVRKEEKIQEREIEEKKEEVIRIIEKPTIKREEKRPMEKKQDAIESVGNQETLLEKSDFYFEIIKFLKDKGIELLEEIQIDKKEFIGKISIASPFGKMIFLLISKNKKSISKDEIVSSIQRATHSKMPCLIIIRKEPTKAIEKFIENNHLIKILSLE